MAPHTSDITLKIGPESLHRTKMGTISGEIWLQGEEWAFPAAHWNDIVIPVLRAWLAAVNDLSRGMRKRDMVHFMDGPYFVELTASANQIELLLTADRPNGEERCCQADAVALRKNAVDAADLLLAKCRELEWNNDDIDHLRRTRDRARA
jgi:hypothetical protein